MPRVASENGTLHRLMEVLLRSGDGAPSEEQKLQYLQAVREQAGVDVERTLVRHLARQHEALLQARADHESLQSTIAGLTAPSWIPATYLHPEPMGDREGAMVFDGNTRRVVGLAEEVDPDTLNTGDLVLLSHELNTILEKVPSRAAGAGDVGRFTRATADGRVMLAFGEMEQLVELAAGVDLATLRDGDSLRCDRRAGVAFEKVEPVQSDKFLVQDTPTESFSDIGGLDVQIEQILRALRLHLHHEGITERYGLRRIGSILLEGPPGTGKTMLARATASELARLQGSGKARFSAIAAGELNSPWHGQSEANWRELFSTATAWAQRDLKTPFVLFIDEIDAVGGTRSGLGMHDVSGRIDERILGTILSLMDGLASRSSNLLLIAATNRRDVLDPGLLRPGRIGDLVLTIPRPNMRAAAQIFDRHLPRKPVYAPGVAGEDPVVARQRVIDAAVSRIYAPNADGHELATLTFSDAKQRKVTTAHLVSGAVIAAIVRSALEKACVREIEGGPTGLTVEDMLVSISEYFETAARGLTPWNCRAHVADLPEMPITRLELSQRKVSRPYRFLDLRALAG